MVRPKKAIGAMDARRSPHASSHRAKRGRRGTRDTEPMGPVRQPRMTPEQRRVYYEGPKPTREDVQRFLRGSHSSGYPLGFKASELGLNPGDWDDPRYREAYQHFMIYRDDIEEDGAGSEDPFSNIELDDYDYGCASD